MAFASLAVGFIGLAYVVASVGAVAVPRPASALSLKPLQQVKAPIKKVSEQTSTGRSTSQKTIQQSSQPEMPAVLPAAKPVRFLAPAAQIDAPLQSMGLKTDGTLNVPSEPFTAGWYNRSPTPGERGPAVIAGHVDNYKTGIAVFWRLNQLQVGDALQVVRADKSVAHFKVYKIKQYSQSQGLPAHEVYSNTTTAELRVITCSGTFSHATDHYSQNLVVFARLTL